VKELWRDSFTDLQEHPILIVPTFCVHVLVFVLTVLHVLYRAHVQPQIANAGTHAVYLGTAHRPPHHYAAAFWQLVIALVIICVGLIGHVIALLVTAQWTASRLSEKYQLPPQPKPALSKLTGGILQLSAFYAFIGAIASIVTLLVVTIVGAASHHPHLLLNATAGVFAIVVFVTAIAIASIVTPESMRLIARAIQGVLADENIALGRRIVLTITPCYALISYLSLRLVHAMPKFSIAGTCVNHLLSLLMLPISVLVCIALTRLTFNYQPAAVQQPEPIL
jgi:hypothetical protein